ncbi:class I SAM-dependent methyltransferase [Marinilabilia rubra]|uniref:Methyltransferase type 11 domain-containing protein n=1 Tax=Marinilabilia rubra TaxID=2162893 RepID=A0A2U2BAJ3_9BACT|nr:class I SAM-dependent methyltransferase [Marinilabilia rubra]PWE00086.1 hypothetical protein DDZ16_06930 [Marinilabilia rubra]
MKNPWLKISPSDYESHMIEVGQLQTLNELTKELLETYRPSSFALLGCCTGNGLEHVDPDVTTNVYAIDVNPGYLEICMERYASQIPGLEVIESDIDKEGLSIPKVDLCFAGLVLEYVKHCEAINNILPVIEEGGTLAIVFQKNREDAFVSKTAYKSLEQLSGISNEINENKLGKWMESSGMTLQSRREVKLANSKSFISLAYTMSR